MLKYINTGVVFSEIPDEVTLSINISNCPCHCPGCHSKYLWADEGTPLTAEELERLVEAQGMAITCVCFMGGDREPLAVEELSKGLRRSHERLKTGWYSGRSTLPHGLDAASFNYIKLGPYLAHLGPLNSRRTNQRLYRVEQDGRMTDMTSRFWR